MNWTGIFAFASIVCLFFGLRKILWMENYPDRKVYKFYFETDAKLVKTGTIVLAVWLLGIATIIASDFRGFLHWLMNG